MKKIQNLYRSPTPAIWRKIGDSILLLGTTFSATFAGMDLGKGWIISCVIITWIGKTITNFASSEKQNVQEEFSDPNVTPAEQQRGPII